MAEKLPMKFNGRSKLGHATMMRNEWTLDG